MYNADFTAKSQGRAEGTAGIAACRYLGGAVEVRREPQGGEETRCCGQPLVQVPADPVPHPQVHAVLCWTGLACLAPTGPTHCPGVSSGPALFMVEMPFQVRG